MFYFALVFLSSCTVLKPAYKVTSNFIDYSFFTEKNFFITESNAVSFNYGSIGSVIAVVNSGYEIKDTIRTVKNNYDVVYGSNNSTTTDKLIYGDFKSANVQDAFSKLYEIAVDKGANGIINLQIKYVEAYFDPMTKIFYTSCFVVTGMLIKK